MRRIIVGVSGVVLGTALIATGAGGNLTSVNDPRGDPRCYLNPCSRSQLRAVDIIKATAGHARGRLKHTVKVLGRFKNGGIYISTDPDPDCERVIAIERGDRYSKVVKCGRSPRPTGRAKLDFHRHSVKVTFGKKSIGSPRRYWWNISTDVYERGQPIAAALDTLPNRGGPIKHRLR